MERVRRLETLREEHVTAKPEDELWHKVLSTLKGQVTETAFKMYLAQSALLSIQDGQAIIVLSNRFAEDWVKKRLAPSLQKVLANYAGQQDLHLQFHTLGEHG
jgi:chromosomal replication initiation ATPase DnaA